MVVTSAAVTSRHVCASGILVLFGFYEQASVWSLIATLPEIAWEATLGSGSV